MRRRDFIAELGGLALWSCPTLAQQRPFKTPRIGIVDNTPIWDNFRQGLHKFGYIEGQNIDIEYRSSGGRQDRLVAAANDLAGGPVEIIVVSGSAAARAA